ncbi:MAG TPA: hypothetical protein VFA44_00890 [Gaiellaceae bacterium]|nr:hypothetical protein [Gaiellaceae bacterium]
MRRLRTAAVPGACLACLGASLLPVLRHAIEAGGPSGRPAPKMTAAALERLLDRAAGASTGGGSSCLGDPNGGWDYVCRTREHTALYHVGADRIVDGLVLR